MQALPKRLVDETFQSEYFDDVVYTLVHTNNAVNTHIQAVNTSYEKGTRKPIYDIGGSGYDLVGFTLRAIQGLEGWEPEFINVKIGKRTFKRLTDECMDAIPRIMFDEINRFISQIEHLLPEEVEAIKNMRNSSPVTDSTTAASAPETSTDAQPDAPSPSQPEQNTEC